MKRENHIGNSGRFALLAAVLAAVVCMAAFVYFRSDSMSGNYMVMGAEYDIKRMTELLIQELSMKEKQEMEIIFSPAGPVRRLKKPFTPA